MTALRPPANHDEGIERLQDLLRKLEEARLFAGNQGVPWVVYLRITPHGNFGGYYPLRATDWHQYYGDRKTSCIHVVTINPDGSAAP